MAREVQVHLSFTVEDDVTDDMIKNWLPSVVCQAQEPEYDAPLEAGSSGFETIEFASSSVFADLYIDGKCHT